jgi:hypothetical protein
MKRRKETTAVNQLDERKHVHLAESRWRQGQYHLKDNLPNHDVIDQTLTGNRSIIIIRRARIIYV